MREPVVSYRSVISNVRAFGSRRIIAFASIALALSAILLAAVYYTGRAANDVLYANLEKAEVSKVASVLREVGQQFDIGSDGVSILVPAGQAPRARLTLADRGLPNGQSVGYEIFDRSGSLGMTSFMQEVTKLRAIEGELARTIQLIRGVRAARVHLVMPDEGSFRRPKQAAQASVIVRTDSTVDSKFPSAIRHLVSAAVPGLKPDSVVLINSDGSVIAGAEDESDLVSGRVRMLERSLSAEIVENVRKTLSPYLSLNNFQVSAIVRLNTDRRQITETIFDPNSRVERSVRVTRETQASANSPQQNTVSVDRNIPQEPNRQGGAVRQSTEESQRREEVTNFELSSKTIQSVSGGYAIEQASIALLINRSALAGSSDQNATQDVIAAKILEIEQIVRSAIGIRNDRDSIKVSAVEFARLVPDLDPFPSPSLIDRLANNSGVLINSITVLLLAGLIVLFVVRPALELLRNERESELSPPLIQGATLSSALSLGQGGELPIDSQIASPLISPRLDQEGSRARLQRQIEEDEAGAVRVLKQWIKDKGVQ